MCLNTGMDAPVQPSVTPGHDPYAFIMNPAPKPKKNFWGGGASMAKRIGIVAGGAAVLIIIVLVFVNIIFGGSSSTDGLISIVQTENEIIRIAGKNSSAVDQVTKNFAVNTQLSITTQQKEWENFLGKYGIVVAPKLLVLKKNLKSDKSLDSAEANSTFDLVFNQMLKSMLNDYKKELNTTYQHTNNKEERTLLDKHYSQINLLLKQLPESAKTESN